MLGGTFGKPLGNQDEQEDNHTREGKHDPTVPHEKIMVIEGDRDLDRHSASRSQSPKYTNSKLPHIEHNQGSSFTEDEPKFDNLSKLVGLVSHTQRKMQQKVKEKSNFPEGVRGGFSTSEQKLTKTGFDEDSKPISPMRSEEHTSELQSQSNLVCRLLLEKKN